MGSVDAVVKQAAHHQTRSIQAHPADFEDLFLSYYHTAPGGDPPSATEGPTHDS